MVIHGIVIVAGRCEELPFLILSFKFSALWRFRQALLKSNFYTIAIASKCDCMPFQLYSPKQWYCQLNSFLAQHNWSQLIIPNNCNIMRNVCNLSCVMFVQFFKIEQFPHENWQSDIIICCCLSFGYCCAWNVMDRNPKNKKAEHRKKTRQFINILLARTESKMMN